ncbi:EAL domain-containing protein [Chitinibacter bivalviorum]|uniref:EAL domain-containing protein n=1 Tax=Chitinibacter bivalviorum TaxID=2739434 RepID=A0A7H9BNM4_9NEIS|nr:EAL domain-containing protein [Chitinibacter bivalviorum]QLG89641.1 EAL domain-containing protein [Chitinibacter bivalviorum]
MTLLKQLIILIAALFVFLFCGTVYLNAQNSRAFLTEQLTTISQDTATSLGMQLSPLILDKNNKVFVERTVDAIFDSGYYREIHIDDMEGKSILVRKSGTHVNNVPDWFIALFPIETPIAESVMTSGWQQAGTIRIAANPGIAYASLWGSSINALIWFSIASIITLILGLFLLHFVLRPLHEVERQAMAICNREYPEAAKLPWTLDLRSVVQAMNRMTQKVKEMFAEQAASIERMRAEAYLDTLTGLANRRYFDVHVKQLMEAEEPLSHAALLFLEISHLKEINDQKGFRVVDNLLVETAALVKGIIGDDASEAFAARMSGNTFAAFFVGVDAEKAQHLGATLVSRIASLHERGMTPFSDVGHVGVAMYHGQKLNNWLSEVDMALRSAQSEGPNIMHFYAPQEATGHGALSASQWKGVLLEALNSQRIELYTQVVNHIDGRLVHREVFVRIRDELGEQIPAGLFVPMAKRHGLIQEFDRVVINLCLKELAKDPTLQLAINLFPASISHPEFVKWLIGKLAAKPELAYQLCFELPEQEAVTQLDDLRTFIEEVGKLGVQVGLDNFGRGFSSFTYLSTLKVHYLKVDGSFSKDIDQNRENQFFMDAMVKIAHGLDLVVIAKSVETPAEQTMLESLRVDGVQGFGVGGTELWKKAPSL